MVPSPWSTNRWPSGASEAVWTFGGIVSGGGAGAAAGKGSGGSGGIALSAALRGVFDALTLLIPAGAGGIVGAAKGGPGIGSRHRVQELNEGRSRGFSEMLGRAPDCFGGGFG